MGGGPAQGGEDAPTQFNFKPKDPYGLEISVSQHVKKKESTAPPQKKPKITKPEEKSTDVQPEPDLSSLQQQVPKKRAENEPIKNAAAIPKQAETKDQTAEPEADEGFQI